MKKIFSFITALLFAGSMFAVTLDPGTQTPVTPVNTTAGDPISLTINEIQIDYTGALGAASGTTPADFRVFANKTLTLTAENTISKVVIAGKANKANFEASVDNGTITTGASYASITTKASIEDPLIVIENIDATSVTLTVTKQLRAYMIEVTFAEGGDDPTPEVVAPYCQTEVGHFFAENADPNSYILLSIGAENGKTIVRIDQDADKNTQMFDYLQVTGLATTGEDVAEGGATAMAVEFDTPAAVDDSITLEILWSTVNWPGRWMVQNVKVPATAACEYAVLVSEPAEEPVVYYIKNNWDGATDWTWQTMTEESEGVWVYEGVFGGTGVNINTKADDDNADWFAITDITAGQTVKFTYDVAAATLATEIQDVPVVVTYYIKSKWAEDASDWTWQPMTEESEGVWVYDGTFYGTGVNINTAASDNGAVWYPLGEAYEGHQLDGDIEVGQNVHFVYNVEAATVTATAIVEPEITTCAQAAEAALSVSGNNVEYNNGAEYTIEGYVTAIQTAFNAQFSNISFWMADTKDGGNVLEAYRAACASADDAPAVGDKVAVTGKLTKYNATPEFAAGCTFVILEKGEVIPEEPAQNLGQKTIAEFLALKNLKDTCILTGVVSNIVNGTYGNFDLTDETGTVYVYGLLTPAGESKKFADLNVAENDTLTILAIYSEFNSNPQAKNAIFVEVKKYVEPVVFSHELYGSEELPAIGKTWFANTSWTVETNSHAEIVNDYDINVVLVEAKAGAWQSQVFVNPGFTWEVGAYYKMEFDLATNHQLGGVAIKVNDDDNNVFYYSYPNDNIFLANQTTHYVADSIYAVVEPTNGGQLIFSVGWCDANTEILISNIVITKYEAPVVGDNFTFTVENIAAASADITVTPADADMPYFWNFVPADLFDIEQINKEYVDAYIEDLEAYIAEEWGMTIDYSYADIASQGIENHSPSGLEQGTEYVVFAFGLDTITGELTTAVATQSFTTVTVPASENVITLTYDTKLNITTTNTDDYMVLIELKEDYDNYEPDMTQASLNAEVDSWNFQDPSARILSGNKSVDPASYYISETQGAVVEAGKEYIALVYPYSTEDGVRNGDVVALVFTYVVPTGIEDIELVEKATKVVSDGQVLIIRDAKMFNVLGARIR